MKRKMTILLFGLLLAVGWTSSAQAQALNPRSVPDARWSVLDFQGERQIMLPSFPGQSQNVTRQAPRRATNDVYADSVMTKAQYHDIHYTWYEGTTTSATPHDARLTDTVTNAHQMYWLFRSTYMNSKIPGIRYNDVFQEATTYFGVGHGWNVGSPTQSDAYVTIYDSYSRLYYIEVSDFDGNTLYTWYAGDDLPTGWSYAGSYTVGRTYYNNNYWYYWATTNGAQVIIPASQLPAEGCNIYVIGQSSSSSTNAKIYITNDANGTYLTFSNNLGAGNYDLWNDYGTVTAPEANGYTLFLLKLEDFPEIELAEDYSNYDEYRAEMNKRSAQYKTQDLIDVFDEYFASVELLTDGLRVGEGTETSGTVFAYTGELNRFYIIGKGKTATKTSQSGFYNFVPEGPFYDMYEEFSPTTTEQGDQTQDLYANMKGGDYYPVKHDCQTVLGLQHYFSMYGRDTTVYKSVAPLVIYIPDLRSVNNDRVYEEGHKPQVGLYTIQLSAETEPSATYAQDSTYTVTLEWSSTLNRMVNNDVPQTYIIYTVTTDSVGNTIYTPLDTVVNPTELIYTYDVPQEVYSQQIEYVIMGFPTDATNNPRNQDGGIFYTYSNPDDVQIPGLFDFMVLYRERYESDFVVGNSIGQERNYYRNYLYPTNLRPGTGMTMGQLKREWPNQTASYTLWRDERGVAKLEVMAIGDKVYYRIQYYEGTQVTDGPNDIDLPYDFNEIPNENN